jgi:membrane protein DedA with SNARE-associated domain/membrane-associated phospholipid phosphatase
LSPSRILAIAATLVLIVVVFRRRDRLSRGQIAIRAIVLALLVAYAAGAFEHVPSSEKLIEDLAKALGQGTYALVGALAFLETGAFVGLIAPGEFAVIVGGVVAGQGTIELIPLLALVWACCIAGDTTSFFVGRRLGRSFIERHGPRFKITPERLEMVEGYFHRHGGKTILIGRFIGLVRAVAPFIAGSSGIPYRRFIPYSVLGTGLWAATYTLLGYFFYRSFEKVASIAGRATLVFATLVALIYGVVTAYRRRGEIREWMEGNRVLAPVLAKVIDPAWRRLRPSLVFVRDRLTPGMLGLELTTALAVAASGLFVFVGYAMVVSQDHRLTPGDERLHTLARDTYSHALERVAEAITVLGSLPVTATLTALACAVLAWRRRGLELVVLLGGFALVYAVVHITKGAIDRPRPPDPLTGASGSAYPSGHAAYSSVYVVLATIAWRMLGTRAGRAGIVMAAILVGAAVGGTRIYLRVHWWSDVAGGWGLGLGIFATLASAALVVDHVRHNWRADAARTGSH